MESDDIKRFILSNANLLHKTEYFKHVFVKPDLTPLQQKLDFELRKELKARRSAHPDKDYVIYNGKVVERDSSRGFRKDF